MSSNHKFPDKSVKQSVSIDINHICLLTKDISALYLSDDFSDITLIVDGQKLSSHKTILAARSQYFRDLLIGGLKESTQHEIELKDTNLTGFKRLLEYMYTGQMPIADECEEVVLNILELVRRYGFSELETSISDHLKKILNMTNIYPIFNAAYLYQLESLTKVCHDYMDKRACEVMKHKNFLQLSADTLTKLISRDSFFAPEIDIFLAAGAWVKANPDAACQNVLDNIRLNLISTTDLLNVVRPTGLVSLEKILDTIAAGTQTPNSVLNHRGKLVADLDVAQFTYGAKVVHGNMRDSCYNDYDYTYNRQKGYARHPISQSKSYCILVKLGTRCIINHIKMLLWDEDTRSYSYYLDVSMDQKHWVRIIDYSGYFCRSWQYLYFQPRVVLYIRIVGTKNTFDDDFHLMSFEAYYTNRTENFYNGFVIPTRNVAIMDHGAIVIEGVCRSRNALLNTSNYKRNSGYKCREDSSGDIMIQLGQPYFINSMRLLLWDCNDRSYSYYIQVSANYRDWIVVANKSREPCHSWQTIRFEPSHPVVFIRIVETHKTSNQVFHCVHFECPAQGNDDD